jgi:hypothetical protein
VRLGVRAELHVQRVEARLHLASKRGELAPDLAAIGARLGAVRVDLAVHAREVLSRLGAVRVYLAVHAREVLSRLRDVLSRLREVLLHLREDLENVAERRFARHDAEVYAATVARARYVVSFGIERGRGPKVTIQLGTGYHMVRVGTNVTRLVQDRAKQTSTMDVTKQN